MAKRKNLFLPEPRWTFVRVLRTSLLLAVLAAMCATAWLAYFAFQPVDVPSNARAFNVDHGRSLRSVIAGQPDGRQAVFGERGEPNSPAAARMIRTRQWKLCLLPKGARELYNLEKDPNETKNVADDPANAAVIRQLEKQLRAHMEAVDDPAARLLQRT